MICFIIYKSKNSCTWRVDIWSVLREIELLEVCDSVGLDLCLTKHFTLFYKWSVPTVSSGSGMEYPNILSFKLNSMGLKKSTGLMVRLLPQNLSDIGFSTLWDAGFWDHDSKVSYNPDLLLVLYWETSLGSWIFDPSNPYRNWAFQTLRWNHIERNMGDKHRISAFHCAALYLPRGQSRQLLITDMVFVLFTVQNIAQNS